MAEGTAGGKAGAIYTDPKVQPTPHGVGVTTPPTDQGGKEVGNYEPVHGFGGTTPPAH